MARWFRVVHTDRYCGLPIVVSSIIFAIITAGLQSYALYFLPLGASIPLIIAAGATGLGGILAALTGFRFLTIIYIIVSALVQLPVFVVIGFTAYTLSSYKSYACEDCRNNGRCFQSDYDNQLCKMDRGLLWSVLVVAWFACVFIGISLTSFRKLRLHQAGVSTVVRGDQRRNHHHHCEPCVIQQPVYTVPATTVVTTTAPHPVFVQANTGMYPVVPPPIYTVATGHPVMPIAPVASLGTVQPVNYNPPSNPDF